TVNFRNNLAETGNINRSLNKFEEDAGLGYQTVGDKVTLFGEKDLEHELFMYGAVCVKDLASNRHFVAASNNHNWTHVEEHLSGRVVKHFTDSEAGLSAAKVIFYIPASPCKQCSKFIPAWCLNMRTAIAKGDKQSGKRVFFVFNFLNYYTATVKGNEKFVWGSATEANDAYASISSTSGLTNFIPCGSQANRLFKVPVINFRQGTKGAQITFGKLANKQVIEKSPKSTRTANRDIHGPTGGAFGDRFR